MTQFKVGDRVAVDNSLYGSLPRKCDGVVREILRGGYSVEIPEARHPTDGMNPGWTFFPEMLKVAE